MVFDEYGQLLERYVLCNVPVPRVLLTFAGTG